ncbi:MAG: hypothetical protein MPN21_09140 [Thermoanaerobaculia bacterium]|nr:hypothetical protein [Thermoanaerobaculia bacterium]
MSRSTRIREALDQPLTSDYIDEKMKNGWRPVAIEWERPAEEGELTLTEVPFGLRVGNDCHHLVEDTGEMDALRVMLAAIVDDLSMSEVARRLNAAGHRRRDGADWTQVEVFELLPRIIEVAPDIYATDAWRDERSQKAERKLRAVS